MASTEFHTPATAAPAQFPALAPASLSTAFLSTTAAQQFAMRPFSPTIPSQEDIDKAKKSESTTAAASAQLEAIRSQANDKLAASTVAAMGANSAYTAAFVTVDQREAEAATAPAKANEAAGLQKRPRTPVPSQQQMPKPPSSPRIRLNEIPCSKGWQRCTTQPWHWKVPGWTSWPARHRKLRCSSKLQLPATPPCPPRRTLHPSRPQP